MSAWERESFHRERILAAYNSFAYAERRISRMTRESMAREDAEMGATDAPAPAASRSRTPSTLTNRDHYQQDRNRGRGQARVPRGNSSRYNPYSTDRPATHDPSPNASLVGRPPPASRPADSPSHHTPADAPPPSETTDFADSEMVDLSTTTTFGTGPTTSSSSTPALSDAIADMERQVAGALAATNPTPRGLGLSQFLTLARLDRWIDPIRPVGVANPNDRSQFWRLLNDDDLARWNALSKAAWQAQEYSNAISARLKERDALYARIEVEYRETEQETNPTRREQAVFEYRALVNEYEAAESELQAFWDATHEERNRPESERAEITQKYRGVIWAFGQVRTLGPVFKNARLPWQTLGARNGQ